MSAATTGHRERVRAALRAQERAADRSPERIELIHGPGRVNLIGEHTDYNAGFVLPAAISLGITLAIIPSADRRVRITQLDGEPVADFDLDALPPPSGSSGDYVAGTAWSLAQDGLPLRGLRGVLASDLPIGAGLSSSAALELASAWAMLATQARPATFDDRMHIARLAQRAENEYVGVRCGVMDQFASSLGEEGNALLLDCRSLEYRAVPLPLDAHMLVVCESGASRSLADSTYNARRAECELALDIIASRMPSVATLRDVTEDILGEVSALLEPTLARRVTHVVRENARTQACAEAFESEDLGAVGRAFAASHQSLRVLYEVSSPELDALVEIASAVPGTIGARLTGAGFGGCTVNIVARAAFARFEETVPREYHARTGLAAKVRAVEPAPGAGLRI